MRSITDLKNELDELIAYKTQDEWKTLTDSERASINLEIFNLEVKIAEAEAEEADRPYEPDFDKYSKWDR